MTTSCPTAQRRALRAFLHRKSVSFPPSRMRALPFQNPCPASNPVCVYGALIAIMLGSWARGSFLRVWPIAHMSVRCRAWFPWQLDRPADRQCGALPRHACANALDHRVWKAFSCTVNNRAIAKFPLGPATRGGEVASL